MLGAVAGPFHRTVQIARSMQTQCILRIRARAHTERTAHVVADHAQFILRNFQHRLRHGLAHEVRALGPGIEGEAVLIFIVLAGAGAWLHRGHGDPRYIQLQRRDVRRLGDGRFDRRLVAFLVNETDIVRCFFPDRRRACAQHVCCRGDRGQLLILNRHQFRSVARLVVALRHHEGHIIADILNELLAQRHVRRDKHF